MYPSRNTGSRYLSLSLSPYGIGEERIKRRLSKRRKKKPRYALPRLARAGEAVNSCALTLARRARRFFVVASRSLFRSR